TGSKQTKMNPNKFINLAFILTISFGHISCIHKKKSNDQTEKSSDSVGTIIVKHKNDLNKSYEVGFYSKSYSYYWLAGKDTLDFVVSAAEHEKDSTLHLS